RGCRARRARDRWRCLRRVDEAYRDGTWRGHARSLGSRRRSPGRRDGAADAGRLAGEIRGGRRGVGGGGGGERRRGGAGGGGGGGGRWLKSKSATRLPRIDRSSRTSGRRSGRWSVRGSSRAP